MVEDIHFGWRIRPAVYGATPLAIFLFQSWMTGYIL